MLPGRVLGQELPIRRGLLAGHVQPGPVLPHDLRFLDDQRTQRSVITGEVQQRQPGLIEQPEVMVGQPQLVGPDLGQVTDVLTGAHALAGAPQQEPVVVRPRLGDHPYPLPPTPPGDTGATVSCTQDPRDATCSGSSCNPARYRAR